MNTVITFEKTDFDVVDIHNVPWLRLPQIEGALGYATGGKALSTLFNRNADEFTDEMTQILDLPTAGGVQPVRIFSPRGCYLLGMLARTEKAKAFRQWVLDVLEGRTTPYQSKPTTVPQRIAAHRLRLSLLAQLQAATAAGLRAALHQQLWDVSRLLAIACPPMDSIGRTVEQPQLPGMDGGAK